MAKAAALVAIVALVMSGISVRVAAQSAPAPAFRAKPIAPRAPAANRDNPFGALFGANAPSRATALVPPRSPRPAVKTPLAPTIKCGMTLVPKDPAFDAEIRTTPPANAPAFPMRAVPAPPCEQQR